MTTATLAPLSLDDAPLEERPAVPFAIECTEDEAAEEAAEGVALSMVQALNGIWDLEETVDRLLQDLFFSPRERPRPSLLTGILHTLLVIFGAARI